MAAVTIQSDFWAQENKACHHSFHCFPSICHEVMGPDIMILAFWMLSFKSAFSLSSLIFIKRLFSYSLFSAIRACHLHIWGFLYFPGMSWFKIVLHPVQYLHHTLHIVKKASWQYRTLRYSFPNFGPIDCFISGSVSHWPAYRFLRSQVRWSGIPISWRILH